MIYSRSELDNKILPGMFPLSNQFIFRGGGGGELGFFAINIEKSNIALESL